MPRVAESGPELVPSGTIVPPPPTPPLPLPPQPPQPPAPPPVPPGPLVPPGAPADLPAGEPTSAAEAERALGVLGKLWFKQLLGQGETWQEAYADALQLQQDGRAYPTGVGPSGVWPPPPPPPPPLPPVPDPDRTLEAVVLGPFAGIGAFASNAPLLAIGHASLLSWVALKADGGDRSPVSAAATLRQAGLDVLVWESVPDEGQAAVERYGASGYIGQAEGAGQLAGALRLGAGLNVPKALVTNLFMGSWPKDWVCLPELYDGDGNPVSVALAVVTARNKGATALAPVAPTFGRGTLAAVRAGLEATGVRHFSLFSLEAANDADWRTLAAIEQQAGAGDTGGGAGDTGGSGGDGSTIPGTGGASGGGGVTPAKVVGPKAAWRTLLQALASTLPGSGVYLRNLGRKLPGV